MLGQASAAFLVFVVIYLFYCKRRVSKYNESKGIQSSEHKEEGGKMERKLNESRRHMTQVFNFLIISRLKTHAHWIRNKI